jgi:hypothetical protein
MFPLINICGEQLSQYIERSDKQIETKEVAGKYATDVITTCAFGIESNSLLNPNAEFREFGRKIFDFSVYRSFEFMSAFMLPFVAKLMGITFFSRETTKFMRKTFWETIKVREQKKIERHDFLQLLIKLKNGEDLSNEKSKKNGVSNENLNGTTGVSNGVVKDSKLVSKCSSYTTNITSLWSSTNRLLYVGFEVLTLVTMKSCVFWDITPCSPNWRNVSPQPSAYYLLHGSFLLGVFFSTEDGGDNFL